MCVIGVIVNEIEEFPLIIINGRDEDIDRPTVDASLQESKIICGLDQKLGGTWCGLHSKTGVFALLTNFVGEWEHVYGSSRGDLIMDCCMNSDGSSKFFEQYQKELFEKKKAPVQYNGFNLFYGNLFDFVSNQQNSGLYFTSNREFLPHPSPNHQMESMRISKGIHAVANSFLNDEDWPKVKFLKNALRSFVDTFSSQLSSMKPEEVRNLLAEVLCSRPHLTPNAPEDFPPFIKDVFIQSKQRLSSLKEKLKNETDAQQKKQIVNKISEVEERLLTLDEYQNNIFVDCVPHERTRSQTIILVHKSGTAYYYYRNTDGIDLPFSKDKSIPLIPTFMLNCNLSSSNDKTTKKVISSEEHKESMKKFASEGWVSFTCSKSMTPQSHST